jgi:hypothetical protein
LARTWSRPVAIMQALDAAGRDLLYRHGASHEACAVFEQLVAVSERFGSIPMQGEALAQLSTSHLTVGGLRHAEEMFRRAQAIAPRLGADHRMHQFGPISRAVTLAYFLDGGWVALAAEAAGYATSSAAHRSPIGLVAAALAALSTCRAGDVPATRELLQHVTSIAERLPATMYAQSVGIAFASTAVWELRAIDYAATYQRLILRLVHAGVGDPPGFGPFDLLLARMAALLGHAGEALDYFERARRKLNALGITHVRAIVDYDEASTLMRWDSADRPRITALLDEALQAFHAHEMQWWASRAAEQKERLMAAAGSCAARDRQYRPA